MGDIVQEFKRRKEDRLPKKNFTSQQTLALIDDAILLAKYCLEKGLLSQTEILERLLVIQSLATSNALSENDIAELIRHFDQVSLIAGNVTAQSLRETDRINKSYWGSRTGRHLLMLWAITGIIGILIFLYNMLDYRVTYYDMAPGDTFVDAHLFWVRLQHYSSFLVPFTYGALGACAFLLRNMAHSLQSRQFDVSHIPQQWNRLFLGALSGGLIVMFANQFQDTGNTSVIQISEGALGFLAGYSIDFLFNTLDRIVSAILPSKGSEPNANLVTALPQDKTNKLLKRYSEQYEKSDNAAEKKVLQKIIRDLK